MAFEREEQERTPSTLGTLVASAAGIPVRADTNMNVVAQESADCFGLLFGRETPYGGTLLGPFPISNTPIWFGLYRFNTCKTQTRTESKAPTLVNLKQKIKISLKRKEYGNAIQGITISRKRLTSCG